MTIEIRKHQFILAVGLMLTMLSACNSSTETTAKSNTNNLAITTHGPIQGAKENGIHVFKGVRYGADTQTTRFSAPATPIPWQTPVTTTQYGASCPQTPTGNPGGLFSSWAPSPTPALNEDCLFLNVWTPAINDGKKRPVMVWFHGGGFSSGSGSSAAYDGVRLALRGDVVVITVNHRLNVFGYLALGHYGDAFKEASVAGVLDMILALEWVRDNAERFGGDANTVTIFGESGGGAKVSTLLTTDRAKGLFHRAIVQSGALIKFPEANKAQAAADKVVANLGLTAENIGNIKTLPADTISLALKGTGAASAPSIDGLTLTRHPFFPDAAPAGKDVPLMLGTNRTENSLFMGAANPALFDLNWQSLAATMKRSYPDKDVDNIVAGYRKLQPDSNAADILFEATTDARWLSGHVTQAERKSDQAGAQTWLYLFNWDTPVDGGKWRSPHALEIGFVFDNVAKSASMSGTGEAQQKVADIMADTWLAFARSGNPNNPAIPQWPEYERGQRSVMVLDESPQIVNDARAAQRALFDDSESYLGRYQR